MCQGLPASRAAELVNTVKRGTDAKTPLMFNYNPWSTLEAVQRWLPLGDCAARQGTNYVSCPHTIMYIPSDVTSG